MHIKASEVAKFANIHPKRIEFWEKCLPEHINLEVEKKWEQAIKVPPGWLRDKTIKESEINYKNDIKVKKGPWKFTDWYDKNREKFLKQRRDRYATDQEYRAKVRATTTASREKLRVLRLTSSDHGSLPIVAERLGVQPWTIGRWCSMNHLPVSDPASHIFTDTQVELMAQLRDFFQNYRTRKHGVGYNRAKTELVASIKERWNT